MILIIPSYSVLLLIDISPFVTVILTSSLIVHPPHLLSSPAFFSWYDRPLRPGIQQRDSLTHTRRTKGRKYRVGRCSLLNSVHRPLLFWVFTRCLAMEAHLEQLLVPMQDRSTYAYRILAWRVVQDAKEREEGKCEKRKVVPALLFMAFTPTRCKIIVEVRLGLVVYTLVHLIIRISSQVV